MIVSAKDAIAIQNKIDGLGTGGSRFEKEFDGFVHVMTKNKRLALAAWMRKHILMLVYADLDPNGQSVYQLLPGWLQGIVDELQ